MAQAAERPHKSTSHQEMFFHIFFDPSATARGYKGATLFCRREHKITGSPWYFSTAYCASTDQFNRAIGRSQARRHYFQGYRYFAGSSKPSYEFLSQWALDEAQAG